METTKSTDISQPGHSAKPKQRRPRKRKPTQVLDRAREKLDELMVDLREYPELSELFPKRSYNPKRPFNARSSRSAKDSLGAPFFLEGSPPNRSASPLSRNTFSIIASSKSAILSPKKSHLD